MTVKGMNMGVDARERCSDTEVIATTKQLSVAHKMTNREKGKTWNKIK